MHEWPPGSWNICGESRGSEKSKNMGGGAGGGDLDLTPMCYSTHIRVWREKSGFSGRLSSSFNLILAHIQASAQCLHVHNCVNARAHVPLQVLVEGVC